MDISGIVEIRPIMGLKSKKERKIYKIPKKLIGYIVKIYYYQYIMSQ